MLLMMLLTAQTAWAAVGDEVDSGTCGDNLTWTLTENGKTVTISSESYAALTLTITGTGAMYDFTSSTCPWNDYRSRVTKLVLPDRITHIGNHAFYFTNFSGKLTIPEGVESIGNSSFYCFYNATWVTLPASVQSIGEKAFQGMGENATNGCKFTAAEGSQLTSIGTEAFRTFNGNVDLRKCKSLTTIGEKAFEDYKSHTVYLPVSTRNIEKDAFYNISVSVTDKPKVYVAYDNSILYINDSNIGTYDTSGTYDITSYLNLMTKSSDAVSIRQYLTNSWGGGDGSSWEQAYVITNTFGLDLLAYYVNEGNDYNGKYFILGADITYTHATAWDDATSTEENYTAISNYINDFKGHFDGQGHTVNGIRIYKGGTTKSSCQGLFGCIAEGAEVKNVTLADARITGYKYVGGIAGYSSGGTISNCHVHSNVCIHTVQTSDAWYHGGIVGQNYQNSTVSHCTSAAQLTVVSGVKTYHYGGIAGSNKGTLEYCLAIGAAIPNCFEDFSGIIVSLNGGTLTQNYYSGCTFAGTPNATGKGIGSSIGQSDVAGQAEPGYLLTLAEGITSDALTVGSYTVAPSGQTVTLGHNRPGYVFGGYESSDVTITNGTFTMPTKDVTVTATWTDMFGMEDGADGSTDHPYIISTASGWEYFCDALNDNGTWNRFSGKTVKLGANIGTAEYPITRMAGSGAGGNLTDSDRPFCGTFDGQGNTLTFNYGKAGNPADENNLAPFRYVNNATIQHLHVAGDIYTQHVHAGGIVGMAYGTTNITDCRSSVNIISSINGDGTHGGIMSCSWTGSTTNITGCLFDGSIQSAEGYETNQCGGFVGWRNATINVANSLLTADLSTIGAATGQQYPSATFVRNGSAGTNCYYTRLLGTAQGKQARTITAGENVTVALSGTATEYTVSGITAYKDGETQLKGLKYGDVLYAGNEDEVSLTLAHTEREGYSCAYTASGGTLSGNDTDGYTLTMPDADVTVSAVFTKLPVTTSYVEANGTLHENIEAIPLDETMTTLAAGTYVVNSNVNYTGTVTLNGDVTLILADGCTMNVGTSESPINGRGIYGPSSPLTIYGQSAGSGKLNVYVTGTNKYGINAKALTINGGNVTADTDGTDADAILAYGDFTYNGGNVRATGSSGINANYGAGTITLGWTNPTDRITASSYSGTLAIADGKVFIDEDGNILSGTVSNLSTINGKTLYPYIEDLDLNANAHDGNFWTTFYCGHTGYKINDGENACAYTATCADNKLTLHKLGKVIPKNTAVIIVGEDNSISMTASTDAAEYNVNNNLHGVDVRTLKSSLGEGTFYVLSKKNGILGFYEYTGAYMPARKAYLLINGGAALAKGLTMVFDDETTAIRTTNYTNYTDSDEWYTINGVKLTSKPTQKGLYIHNGRKEVVK